MSRVRIIQLEETYHFHVRGVVFKGAGRLAYNEKSNSDDDSITYIRRDRPMDDESTASKNHSTRRLPRLTEPDAPVDERITPDVKRMATTRSLTSTLAPPADNNDMTICLWNGHAGQANGHGSENGGRLTFLGRNILNDFSFDKWHLRASN